MQKRGRRGTFSTSTNFQKFPLRGHTHLKGKKHANRDSHIASSPISQSSFFEKVCCLILASSRRKLHGYIEILKFDVTIKKNFNSN